MDDIIKELNKLALEILETAEVFDKPLKDTTEALERLETALKKLCAALERICTLLEKAKSPLRWLVNKADQVAYSVPLRTVVQFLREHRKAIEAVCGKGKFTKRVMDALDGEVRAGGSNQLDKPQDIDLDRVLDPLREFRNLICEIAHSAGLKALIAAPEMLKAIVSGTAGVALVVLDITTAAAVAPHDLTGWVIFKAVKSVWSGVTKVRKAIGKLKDGWASIKAKLTAAKGLENLKKNAGKVSKPRKP